MDRIYPAGLSICCYHGNTPIWWSQLPRQPWSSAYEPKQQVNKGRRVIFHESKMVGRNTMKAFKSTCHVSNRNYTCLFTCGIIFLVFLRNGTIHSDQVLWCDAILGHWNVYITLAICFTHTNRFKIEIDITDLIPSYWIAITRHPLFTDVVNADWPKS